MSRNRNDEEGLAIGFISLSDFFLVGLITAAALARHTAFDLEQTRNDLSQERQQIQMIRAEVSQLKSRLLQIEQQRDRLREIAKSHFDDLIALISILDSKLPEIELVWSELAEARQVMRQLKARLSQVEQQRNRIREIAKSHFDDLIALTSKMDSKLQEIGRLELRLRDATGNQKFNQHELAEAQHEILRLRALFARVTQHREQLRQLALFQFDELVSFTFKIDDFTRQIRNFESLLRGMDDEIRNLKQQQSLLPKDLIGLKGDLRNVVFVIDCSGSMKAAVIGSGNGAAGSVSWWQLVTDTIRLWLQILPMEHAALVYFDDTVSPFPSKEKFVAVKTNRHDLINNLNKRAEPAPLAGTNTLLALQTAYEMPDVDTIILFTDGDPNRTPVPFVFGDASSINPKDYSRKYSEKCWDQIFEYVRKKQDAGVRVPINVVALGNYFDGLYGPNLVELSTMTGGTFLGRGGGVRNAEPSEKTPATK